MPSCQALAPAAVAAFAWESFRLTIALGGSCCAKTQLLMALNMAVPLIPAPTTLIRPPVATRAKPTIMALEFAEPPGMPVMDDRVLVIVSPDVGRTQVASVPARARRHSPAAGDVTPGLEFPARGPGQLAASSIAIPCGVNGLQMGWHAVDMTDDGRPSETGPPPDARPPD